MCMRVKAAQDMSIIKSIAGSWISVPGQGSLWPEEQFSKNAIGWNLFGHAIRSGSGMGLSESDVKLLIDPSLNRLTWKYASDFSPQEFPLDGTKKEYVPQIFSSNKGLWQCTSRSDTEIRALMQPQLSDSSGAAMIAVTVQLQQNRDRLKVDMEYQDKSITHTHYLQRVKSPQPAALPGGRGPENKKKQKKSLVQLAEKRDEDESTLSAFKRKIMWWRSSKPATIA